MRRGRRIGGISPALHKRSVTRPKPIVHPAGIAWPPHFRGVRAMFLRRRRLIATTGLAAASLGLPRIAIGQADQRPSITIAVQQIANSASLEPLREQSNVGQPGAFLPVAAPVLYG